VIYCQFFTRKGSMRHFMLIFLVSMVSAPCVCAHHVSYKVEAGDVYQVTAQYGNNSPLLHAAFEVRSPDDGLVYISGVTNALGQLSFEPNCLGTWTVDIRTTDGHGAHIVIPVTDDRQLLDNSRWSFSRHWRIALGFAVIIGLTMIVTRIRAT
jgi:hypothetical protein